MPSFPSSFAPLLVALSLPLPACGGAIPAPALAHRQNQVGVEQLGADRLDDAEAAFRLALELDPRLVEAHNNLALVLLRRGEDDAARRYLEAMVQREPESEELWSNLGVARLRVGELRAAEEAFGRALAIDPTMISARSNVVRLLVRQERWVPARAHLLRLLALLAADPEELAPRADILGFLAFVELQLGRPAEAEERADAALSLDPRCPPASVVRGTLRGLRGDLAGALADLQPVAHDPDLGFAARVRLATIAGLAGLAEADELRDELVREAPEHPAVQILVRRVDPISEAGSPPDHEGPAEEARWRPRARIIDLNDSRDVP